MSRMEHLVDGQVQIFKDNLRHSLNGDRARNNKMVRIPRVFGVWHRTRPIRPRPQGDGPRLGDGWQGKVAVPLKRAVTDGYGESVITRQYGALQRLHERGRSILRTAQDDYRDLRT